MPINKNSLNKALKAIDPSEWAGFACVDIDRLSKIPWMNLEYFRRQESDPPDGSMKQIRMDGTTAIPYTRKKADLFKSNGSRFALLKGTVLYLATNFQTAACETIDEFRGHPALKSELVNCYMKGKYSPKSLKKEKKYGFPEKLSPFTTAKILDLRNERCAFLKSIKRQGIDTHSLYHDVIRSRDKRVYPTTHHIAEVASRNRFNGICYRSVRTPADQDESNECLAIYGPSVLKHWT